MSHEQTPGTPTRLVLPTRDFGLPSVTSNRREVPARAHRGLLSNVPDKYRYIGYTSRFQRMKIMGLTLLIILGVAVVVGAWFIPAASCLADPTLSPLDGSQQTCYNEDDRRLGIQVILFCAGIGTSIMAFRALWKHPNQHLDR